MITWVMFLAVGILIGIGVGLYMSRLDDAAKRTQNSLSQQLVEKEQEMAAYKEQVNGHFVTTANLVNNMTQSYRAVHEHLSTGANILCKDGADVNSIPFEEKKMIAEAPATEALADQPESAEVASIDSNLSDSVELTDQNKVASTQQEDQDASSEASGTEHKDLESEPQVVVEKQAIEAEEEEPVAVTLQEQEASTADENNKLEVSESDQVAGQENPGAANDEEQNSDNLAADSVVSDIEKSRVNASRMVH